MDHGGLIKLIYHSSQPILFRYLLGRDLLVAPVTVQGAISRSVYFPAGAHWKNFFNESVIIPGGSTVVVDAPLDIIPVYWRV